MVWQASLIFSGKESLSDSFLSASDLGEQFSNPHVDHDFPHVNFLAYLSDTGGRTFVDGEEFNPSEDDAIIFTGRHYLELPKKGRRIVIVGTMFGFT